jgi:hypothetical protein
MNEEDKKLLLAFVNEAAAHVNKNGSESLTAQTRSFSKGGQASLTEVGVLWKRRMPVAENFVTKYRGMSRQIEAYVEQLPTSAVQTMIVIDATAMAEATATEISDELEKLHRVRAEIDQVDDRSVAARPLVDQLETHNAAALRQERMAPIEGVAGQGKPVTVEEGVPAVNKIGLFGAVDVPAENAEPKSSKNAEEICELILEGLRQAEGFPARGVDLTVYGFGAYWNAMMTFTPGATTYARASVFRKVLPPLVVELRKRFELA